MKHYENKYFLFLATELNLLDRLDEQVRKNVFKLPLDLMSYPIIVIAPSYHTNGGQIDISDRREQRKDMTKQINSIRHWCL